MTLSIREATTDDIPDIARIHVDGWRGAYDGIIDQSYLDSKTLEDRIAFWTMIFEENQNIPLLAFLDDIPVGFISYGPLRTAPPGTSKIRPAYSSEIYALYLIPKYYRQGIGRTLIKKAIENLKSQKHQSTCLWVLKDNKRGCAFYDSMGGQRIGKKIVEFGPSKAKEICYGWRDISEILGK